MTPAAMRWLSRSSTGRVPAHHRPVAGRRPGRAGRARCSAWRWRPAARPGCTRPGTSRTAATRVADAPPSARSTKPAATKASSTTGMCLSTNVYMQGEGHVHADQHGQRRLAEPQARRPRRPAARAPASTSACARGSRPDATARCRLTGCSRSRSASTTSLTKYTAAEAAVNTTAAHQRVPQAVVPAQRGRRPAAPRTPAGSSATAGAGRSARRRPASAPGRGDRARRRSAPADGRAARARDVTARTPP